jgi:hypothetical protein
MESTTMTSADALPQPSLRQRYALNVPRDADDVDFLMEHLNDPNYDLKNSRPSLHYDEYNLSAGKKEYASSDIDNESQFGSDRYSTSRADSRNSTAIEFDECVLSYFCITLALIIILVNRRTLKCALPWLASTTLSCP